MIKIIFKKSKNSSVTKHPRLQNLQVLVHKTLTLDHTARPSTTIIMVSDIGFLWKGWSRGDLNIWEETAALSRRGDPSRAPALARAAATGTSRSAAQKPEIILLNFGVEKLILIEFQMCVESRTKGQ